MSNVQNIITSIQFYSKSFLKTFFMLKNFLKFFTEQLGSNQWPISKTYSLTFQKIDMFCSLDQNNIE